MTIFSLLGRKSNQNYAQILNILFELSLFVVVIKLQYNNIVDGI